jgi:hypothetical protein
MMGRQTSDQSQLFYLFNLEQRTPEGHLLRRMNPIVTRVLADLREKLAPFYSDIGRPSIDPELMVRMLIVGCYGIRFERRLCEEVELHLSGRHRTRPLDIHGQSARPLPRQRPLAPRVRGSGAGLYGRWLGQGGTRVHPTRKKPHPVLGPTKVLELYSARNVGQYASTWRTARRISTVAMNRRRG